MKNQNLTVLSNIICKAIEKAYGLDYTEEDLYFEDFFEMNSSVEATVIIDEHEFDFNLSTNGGPQTILLINAGDGCKDLSVVEERMNDFLNSPEGAPFDINTAVECEDDCLIIVKDLDAQTEAEAVDEVCDVLKLMDPRHRPKPLADLLALFE